MTAPLSANAPLVSVCIDVYNYADFLPTAIESVLEQSLTDWELLIVDDCSTDASFEIAQRYARADRRIVAHRNATNLGMVRNRNVGLRLASGEYVKLLHADDFLYHPVALARMVALMESNAALALVASALRAVDAEGQPKTQHPLFFVEGSLIAGTTVIARSLCEQRNIIGPPSVVMLRRRLAQRGFDESYFHAADWEMWFHLLEQGCFGFIEEPLVAYRWHPRQQTERDKATFSQADDARALLDTYLSKPYMRVKKWQKAALNHAVTRQKVRRAHALGQSPLAHATLRDYGKGQYLSHATLRPFWKKLNASSRFAVSPRAYGQANITSPTKPQGINIAGFFKGEFGIGESSRAYAQAAQASGLPCVLFNTHSASHRNADETLTNFASANPYSVNLMTFSFDYARRFYRDHQARFFVGRRNVAIWYWELEKFPAHFHSNFDYYDEIWTPTQFCHDAFAQVSPIPIRVVPYPLAPETALPDRAAYDLADNMTTFLFNFDFHSTTARKNPLAVIQAFQRAFRPDDKVKLLLKSINGAHYPQERDSLRLAAQEAQVLWLEDHVSRAQMNALFASADCYVSLHRSEGLGLGMAQTMALGKPVIATGYSGNLEFMNSENSLLVSYRMTELERACATYPAGALWADPDVEHAAQLMRWVHEHRSEAAQLGARARHDVTQTMNPTITTQHIAHRVRELTG